MWPGPRFPQMIGITRRLHQLPTTRLLVKWGFFGNDPRNEGCAMLFSCPSWELVPRTR